MGANLVLAVENCSGLLLVPTPSALKMSCNPLGPHVEVSVVVVYDSFSRLGDETTSIRSLTNL